MDRLGRVGDRVAGDGADDDAVGADRVRMGRGRAARDRARALFLDPANTFGCAETTLVVLAEAYGLPHADDPSPALALNGGVAYAGGVCGALTGAAVAVGLLAGARRSDHGAAKASARTAVADLVEAFEAAHGAIDCRTLLGCSIRTSAEHTAFIDGGVWRRTCMAQIEFVVEWLAGLGHEPAWPPRDVAPIVRAARIARPRAAAQAGTRNASRSRARSDGSRRKPSAK